MFYSDVILSKKGKLSNVWLAAHAERQVTKAMVKDTNIVKTVSTIMNKRDDQEALPMSLRLSGQLLFGVTRICYRQAKYLSDDCVDVFNKVKKAFHSGVVDMTMQTSRGAITLAPRGFGLDATLPDPMFEGWDVDSVAGGSVARSVRSQSYTARPEDITRQRLQVEPQGGHLDAWQSENFFDPDAGADFQLDVEPGMERRDSQGREVDANGDPVESDGSSIGVGRDAASVAGRYSLLNIGDMTDDFGLGGGEGVFDLGLEEFDAQRRSRTPTRQTMDESSLMQNLTPRTALKVQQAAEKRALAEERTRKQRVDVRTELQDDRSRPSQVGRGDNMSILTQERYLPRSRAHLQLLEWNANPARHILPFTSIGSTMTFTGSKGLAPQLSELFTFDANVLRRHRSASVEDVEDDRGDKRPRRDTADDDISIEVGRRAEPGDLTLPGDLASLGPDMTFDDFGGDEGVPFDLPVMEQDDASVADAGPRRSQRKRPSAVGGGAQLSERGNTFEQRGDLPRLATPSVTSGEGERRESVFESPSSSNLLRAFEGKVASDAVNLAAETQASSQAGLSKNTVRAIKVLQKEFKRQDDDDDADADEDTTTTTPQGRELSFEKITTNATRRAAAGFFFELLVLGSKSDISVEQEESYSDIRIRAKQSLWDEDLTAIVSS